MIPIIEFIKNLPIKFESTKLFKNLFFKNFVKIVTRKKEGNSLLNKFFTLHLYILHSW